MCPLSVHESPSGSVMTGCSAGKVQLSRSHLSQPTPPLPPPQRPPLFSYSSPATASVLTLLRTPAQQQQEDSPPRVSSVGSQAQAVGVVSPYDQADDQQQRRRRSAWTIWRRGRALGFDVLTQVGNLRVRCLLILFLVLSLHSQSAMCSIPYMRESVTHVYFRSKLCQPVSDETLRARLASIGGESGSPHGMQADDANAGWGFSQSSFYDQEEKDDEVADKEEDDDDGYYRKKKLPYGLSAEAEKMKGDGEDIEEEEEEDAKGWAKDRSYGGRGERTLRRALLRKRKNHDEAHPREERQLADEFDTGYGQDGTDSHHAANTLYSMRRRRRRRADEQSLTSKDATRFLRSRNVSRKNLVDTRPKDGRGRGGRTSTSRSFRKSDDLQITSLQLSTKRNNRKIRRKLRKEFRQLVRKQNKPPPWDCRYSPVNQPAKENIFPRSVNNGICEPSKCFFNLYACEPIKYKLNVYKKLLNICHPVPLVGNTTVYEEAWLKDDMDVTVGCKCASLAAGGRRRRKN